MMAWPTKNCIPANDQLLQHPIRKHRLAMGLGVQRLSLALRGGIGPDRLTQIEAWEVIATDDELAELARMFNCEVNEIDYGLMDSD